MSDTFSDDAFFASLDGASFGRAPMSAAAKAALGQGGADARKQGPQARRGGGGGGGGGAGFMDFMGGGGSDLIGSGLGFIGNMIGLGVQDQQVRDGFSPSAMPLYNPAAPAPAPAPASSGGSDAAAMMLLMQQQQQQQQAEQNRLAALAAQQSGGMSSGMMVLGGLLGLGLFGTLLTLLVRGKGSSNQIGGYRNDDLGFSDAFASF